MKIQALFLKIKIGRVDEKELDFLTKNDLIKQQIIGLCTNRKNDLIEHEEAFYFIAKEMIDYITQTHNEDKEKFICDIIKQILT